MNKGNGMSIIATALWEVAEFKLSFDLYQK